MSREQKDVVGLCARCRHARIVETPRSRFWLCDKSRHDPAFPRYPRLPVLACAGHEPGTPTAWREATESGGGERSDG
jgi:hypothetical protein